MAGREGGTVDGAALSFPEDPIDKKPAMLQAFRQGLIGLSVSNVWRGHGSALFIEFGTLKPTTRLDGTVGEGSGEFGLMIEWSWRSSFMTAEGDPEWALFDRRHTPPATIVSRHGVVCREN